MTMQLRFESAEDTEDVPPFRTDDFGNFCAAPSLLQYGGTTSVSSEPPDETA